MRIRAAVLREPGRPVAIEEVELDPPKRDEVLVRIAAAGVCHSDVRLADGELGAGRWPAVLGHEGAGVVEAVGDGVTHVEAGDHVALCFVPACRSCRYCLAGTPNLCVVVGEAGARGMLLDGTSRLRARTARRCSTVCGLPALRTTQSSRLAAQCPFHATCRCGRRRSSDAGS